MTQYLFTSSMFNTHSMPTFPIGKMFTGLLCLILLSLLAQTAALAGVQHYQAELANVEWSASSTNMDCSLSHDIPLYGRASFAQGVGGKLQFSMTVQREATRNRDKAHLRSLPPEWKHQIPAVDLDDVTINKGDTPFMLDQQIAMRMLAELEKGMFPTFSYRDWVDARDLVTVSLPGINIKDALDEFLQCLVNLPVYKFTDFQESLVNFAFGKYSLDSKARNRLDDVARYLNTNPEVVRVEISGHTDDIGQSRANQKLGEQRSNAVRDYLISKGVPASLFKLISYGENNPVDTNNTDSGRANNRRATVRLIK